ncbi:hypothetical protein CCACVL1_12531 [Corchorus capsularis]|uniref:PGG domain-containing protein n=1 Tax=Corchorus capsularis TaxID=210143 RepID=A0A1R3IFA1_COCAP|nr:hypothetical protein CCACVL1_12531 [Corchorus capsularis]
MEKRLCEAAIEGNLISFRNLLQEDALLLDRFIIGCYPETPLHIVSMLGHIDIVEEILARKPELTKQLNIQKMSPLHLATAKGYPNIVKKLVEVNPDMCLVCDQDGRSPLYIAATEGHTIILKELFQARPRAAWFLMDGGETILHACVRSNHFQAMKFLVQEKVADHEFVNSKNCDGNTVLHLAVADKQIEAVNFLIANTTVEINSLNSDGFTALDLLSERNVKDKEMADSIRSIGGVNARNTPLSMHELRAIRTKILTSPSSNQIHPLNTGKKKKGGRKFGRRHEDWLEEIRSSLMVVASLLATMAFQAGTNPPGGHYSVAHKWTTIEAKVFYVDFDGHHVGCCYCYGNHISRGDSTSHPGPSSRLNAYQCRRDWIRGLVGPDAAAAS